MTEEIFLMIILIIGWTTSIAIELQCKKWHNKYDEAVELYSNEIDRKNNVIEDLDNQLELYKSNERVIKIEQVHLEPRILECKFSMLPMFVDDTETFKKIIISETARYIAEELERDPYLCKIFHSVNAFDCREDIKVQFRMLPYAEGVIWDDLFKKEEK